MHPFAGPVWAVPGTHHLEEFIDWKRPGLSVSGLLLFYFTRHVKTDYNSLEADGMAPVADVISQDPVDGQVSSDKEIHQNLNVPPEQRGNADTPDENNAAVNNAAVNNADENNAFVAASEKPSPIHPDHLATAADELSRFYQRERRESVAIQIIATILVLFALYATRAIMLPIVFAFLLAMTLRPVVRRMRKWGVPDIVGSVVTLIMIVAVLLLGTINLVGPARHWIEAMPDNVNLLKEKIGAMTGDLENFTATAEHMDKLANGERGNRPIPVEIQQSRLSSNISILSNTGNVFGSTFLVLGLTFFVLAWGDGLLNNVLRLLNTFSEKKRTVELIYDVEKGVASYLLLVTAINIGLGVATGLVLWGLGVPNAALWGVMATFCNYIPVFGAIACFALITVISILSFESMSYAMIPPIAFVLLTTIESNVITPSLLGKSMSLNPILVFVALIFWGWIWGIGGAFLAVPLLAVAKVACEKFEKTKPFATLMEA